MPLPRQLAGLAFVAVLAACTTAQTRIKRHQAEFDSYPTSIQHKIRDGRADVGFTREQVELALGRPDRRYSRKTAAAVQEVWAYEGDSGAPRTGISFGLGTGGAGAFGGGTETAAGSDGGLDVRVRVVFQNDAVVSVESPLE